MTIDNCGVAGGDDLNNDTSSVTFGDTLSRGGGIKFVAVATHSLSIVNYQFIKVILCYRN